MALIDKEELLRVLRAYNPWWETQKIPASFAKKLHRTAYYQAFNIFNTPTLKRAIVLSGPRRVGKTTILYQIADQSIQKGTSPEQVLYLTLEHPILKLVPIDQLLDLYSKEITGSKESAIVLLDELQYIDRPTQWLKILVDRFPNWKIIATGSASIALKGKDKESGVGRWIEVPVPTLSFFEYILIKKYESGEGAAPEFETNVLPSQLHTLPSHEQQKIVRVLSPVAKELPGFILQGGFPETALQDDVALAQRLLREDIVDKVLKRDMAAFYGVRKLPELEKLFVYLCIHTGAIVNFSEVGKELAISKPTVYALLKALEGAHLIRAVHSLDITGKKVLKRTTKWYIVDASIRNAVLLRGKELILDPQEMGVVIEIAAISQLSTFDYPVQPKIGYWKNGKGKEVDLIVDTPNGSPIAVEIKYREQVSMGSGEGIFDYLKSHEDATGLVITKNSESIMRREIVDKNGDKASITLIPTHIFLYLLGHAEYRRNQKKV